MPFPCSDSLHAYTCVLAPEIHRFIDMGKNCEDIAMNMMVSGMTGLPPVCFEEHQVLDFGTSRGISISSAFTHRRDQCTADLIQLFGRDTLVESREFVRQFDANKFRKVRWEELDDVLVSLAPLPLSRRTVSQCQTELAVARQAMEEEARAGKAKAKP